MFSFLLGLFGLGYYATRLSSERADNKKYDKWWNCREELKEDINERLKMLTAQQIEARKIFYSGAYYDEICDELEEELTHMFGVEFRDITPIPPYEDRWWSQCNSTANHAMIYIEAIWQIKRYGKLIDTSKITFGDSILSCYGFFYDWSWQDISIKSIQCLEKVLHEKGFDDIKFEFTIPSPRINGILKDPDNLFLGQFVDSRFAVFPSARMWDTWDSPLIPIDQMELHNNK